MKYKPTQLSTGKWAVSAGKNKYYPDTIRNTKEETIELGLIRKLVDYAEKSRAVYDELYKRYPSLYTEPGNCREGSKCNYGDLLA